ncbi:hypothetical protein KC887_05190 [Candidatus Kaiserbacteria bacterium]|nr:hypothetical protein [Candidatus Kaiserbacteria bacterium]
MPDFNGNKPILVIDNPYIEVSDGHHTFDELYKYRMVFHMEACRLWLSEGLTVVRSKYHSNGELCFGGAYFIVVAELPTGQVSNHYKVKYEPYFDFIPGTYLPPTYDGHTPKQALHRMRLYSLGKTKKGKV